MVEKFSKEFLEKRFSNLISSWETRTIDDLYKEINNGDLELIITGNKSLLSIDVGFCQIRSSKGYLKESSQVWGNGKVLYRNIPVSGKLKKGKNKEKN
jgi:hypothetical protein